MYSSGITNLEEYKKFLEEIKGKDAESWKPLKESMAIGIIEAFLESEIKMAEVNLNKMPKPEPRKGSTPKSTKQDSFASSFYAWKKKESTKDRLSQLGIDILLIRRGPAVALKKVKRNRK